MKHFSFPVHAHGAFHPPGTPLLPAEDQGFQLGMSVFETLFVEDGHPYFLSQHLERLGRGARGIFIPWPLPRDVGDPGEALCALVEHIDRQSGAPRQYAVRITLSAGVAGQVPVLILTARAIERPPGPAVRLWISSLRTPEDALANVKGTSRMRHVMARREAQAGGAYEALFLNAAGDLAEGTISNVFVFEGGVLRTPAIGSGCLGGIMREMILGDLERQPLAVDGHGKLALEVGPVTLAHLSRSEEVFLTNSTARVLPVENVLACPAPAPELRGAAGPVAQAVRARIDALEEVDRTEGRPGAAHPEQEHAK